MNAPAALDLPVAGVRSIGGLAIGVSVILGVATLGDTTDPVPSIVAAVYTLVVGAGALWSTTDRMPRTLTVAVATSPAVLALTAGPSAGDAAHSTWYLGAGLFLLMLLGLRSRLIAAWLGMVGMIVATFAVDIAQGVAGLDTALVLARQAALLAVTTIFALSIRGGRRRLERLMGAGVEDTRREAARRAAALERNARLEWAGLVASPILRRVANGEPRSAEVRRAAELTEAELRDGLRGGRLAHEPVTSAAREARARGVEVVLLDDRGRDDLDPHEQERVWEAVALALDGAESGRVVVRLLPAHRDETFTVVAHARDEQPAVAGIDLA